MPWMFLISSQSLFNVSVSEFVELDKQLDALNSVLDMLEAKNDSIREQMKEMLDSNREEREKAKHLSQQNGSSPET